MRPFLLYIYIYQIGDGVTGGSDDSDYKNPYLKGGGELVADEICGGGGGGGVGAEELLELADGDPGIHFISELKDGKKFLFSNFF